MEQHDHSPGDGPPRARKKAAKAVGPRLRILLYAVFALVALLVANSIYLVSIKVLGASTGANYENFFYLCMFGAHVVLGLVLLAPFVVFGILHLLAARGRRNRRAIKIGYALFGVGVLILVSGVLLLRLEGIVELKDPIARSVVYWSHASGVLVAFWLFWLHRLAGPRIKWRVAAVYLGSVGVLVVVMVFLQSLDPRDWNRPGPTTWKEYGHPSLARTATGNYIPAKALMNDQYCAKCHADAHEGWSHSVHRFSSFNNPAYLASIRETRSVLLERDGNVKASRWCAGCHDPVPLLSGAFDQPDYDDVHDPTAHAGITCTVCHAMTNVNSNRGNADYTIEEPMHYPFASSENSVLQYVNNQLIKAKPSFHKAQFLKPFHKTAELCSTCHKVHLPRELNQYKDFLRGQNHYDSFLLSGVSGHGARSFYYPPKAQANCNNCHMPLRASDDFGARKFDGADRPSIHSHLFPSANTAIAWWRNEEEIIAAHQEFLKDVVRVDVFGIRENGTIDGELHAPLRPSVPSLKPGGKYLLETVIRTLKVGHPFTQGTADSNEIWMEVTVTAGGRVIGRSGALDEDRAVDPWSHFVNVFMLDREGNRIARRNAQDIFVPLYNHQIPPGAGQTVHYELNIPPDLTDPVTVEIKLNYRKFDKEYTDFMARNALPGDKALRGLEAGKAYRNELPITVLAEDRITLPVQGLASPAAETSAIPAWERWNDYGIGLLLKGKGELRQATAAFEQVEAEGRYDGPLNLARVYHREGRLDEAVEALNRARNHENPAAPHWTLSWLSGLVNREQGQLDEATRSFRSVLEDKTPEMVARGFDFSLDYEVINLLGETLFDLAKQEIGPSRAARRTDLLERAAATFRDTLAIDSENVTAHYNLQLLYAQLGDTANSAKHRQLHQRYKPDDNAKDRAVALARKKYPAADHAAEAVVIYPLTRPGAPGLEPAAD